MKRDEYLHELRLSLQKDDFSQVEEAIAYFNELLEDKILEEGMAEEAAVAQMESPQTIAQQILDSHLKEQNEKTVHTKTSEPEQEALEPGIRTIHVKANQVRNMTVIDRNMRLKVLGENREDIEINHPETERIRYDFSLQNGFLSLVRQEAKMSFQFFLFDLPPKELRQLVVKVPKELAANLEFKTSNAKLSLEHFHCWGSLQANSSNASIHIMNIRAKSVTLKTSNAPIFIEQLEAQQGVKARTSNGNIKTFHTFAPQELHLETSNASIQVDEISSNNYFFQTSNGSIGGRLPGSLSEHSVASGTTNGKNSLPSHTSNGQILLSARTSNANISLCFDEEKHVSESEKQFSTLSKTSMEQQFSNTLNSLEKQLDTLGSSLSQGIEAKIDSMIERLENLKRKTDGQ